jgi:EmrB/QacA subfamily drug resistance transporter
MLTSAVTGLLVGKLSDMYGRRIFILWGLFIFMVGAFLTGTSTDIVQLIIYRGVQGFGAGFIMSTAFTAIGDLFPPRERGKWSGLMSAVFGLSSVIGPFLGGYIVDNADWKWVFWVNLPIGVIAFLMIWRLFPKHTAKNTGRVDYAGALFVSVFLTTLLLAFSWAGQKYAWDSTQIISLFVAAAISLVIFIFIERRAEQAVLPMHLFKNSIFVVTNIVGMITGIAMFGAIMYIPLFVQGVIGTSATASGLVTMPMMIGLVFSSAISGQITSRTGKYKFLAIIGGVVLAIGMYLLSLMDVETNNLTAGINMVIVGAGLGLTMPVFLLAVQNSTPQALLGVTSASVQLFRQVGGTIGVAIMGTLLNHQIKDQMEATMTEPVRKFLSAPGVAENADKLMNPQLLIAHDQLAAFRAQMPAQVQPVFDQLLELLKGALTVGLSHVFWVGFCLAIAGLAITFFLKEVPLRTSNREEKPATGKETGEATT